LGTGKRVLATGLVSLGQSRGEPDLSLRLSAREKVFGPGRAVPLDWNAKCRIAAYARAWSARNRQPRQHHGPITMAFERVLMALLWSFHNSRDGRCFPGYERIAEQARCARSTVAEALKALEWAGVLTWQHRITHIREPYTDLFGCISWRWRVIRTSNAYVFRDPKGLLNDNCFDYGGGFGSIV
jgi:hypothetical protein